MIFKKKRKIVVLVDGPNMLRKEIGLNLEDIRESLKQIGDIVSGIVYLNQHASDKLIEAVANQGFIPKVVPGDVDVYLAVDGTELIFNQNIDTLALVTRDADFLPLLTKAKEKGKYTIVIGMEPGFSSALKNIADQVIILNQPK